jgi:hypothetical protein
MKLLIKVLTLAMIVNAYSWVVPSTVSAQETEVSIQLFYDNLSPYGSWVNYQDYGYVWIPDVDREFSPYRSNGHWIFTEDGWTWVSDYSWGWAPFHYGRWAYDNDYGWLWVPHNEWGPAWVTWRRSEGYYGWAPMGPGISIELSFGGSYRVPNERWTFVSDRDINRRDIDRHYVDRSTNVTIINNSTVINNTRTDERRHTKYVAGPERDDVQKVTGAPVRTVAIREDDKPGQSLNNDQLKIYRPRVRTMDKADRKPAPARLVNLKEVKRVSERKPGNEARSDKRSDTPAQPPDKKPRGGRTDGEKPQTIDPPVKTRNSDELRRPGTMKPSGKPGREQQPGTVNPPPQNNRGDMPERPRIVPPPDNKRNSDELRRPGTMKPSGKPGKEQQPGSVNPPGHDNRSDTPVRPRIVPPPDNNRNADELRRPELMKPSDNNRKEPPQRDVKPPFKNTRTEEKLKPDNEQRKPPQITKPLNDERKKRGSSRPGPTRQNPDSTKPHPRMLDSMPSMWRNGTAANDPDHVSC